MQKRLRTLVLGRGLGDPASGVVLGLCLALPAYPFMLAGPASPFVGAAAVVVGAAGVLFTLRSDPGLLAVWIAMVLPLYFLVSALSACGPVHGPAVASCLAPPPDRVTWMLAAITALVISLLAYSVRYAIRMVPRIRQGVSREGPSDQ